MGKLKDGLQRLAKLLKSFDEQLESLQPELASLANDISHLMGHVKGGYAVMYVHLTESFKKRGETVQSQKGFTVSDLNDPKLNEFIKAIEETRPKALQKFLDWSELSKRDGKRLLASLNALSTDVAAINTMIAAKQKKLLQSPKYKTKIKAYAAELAKLNDSLKESKALLSKSSTELNPDTKGWLEKRKLTGSTTVGELVANVDGLDKMATDALQRGKKAVEQRRKWRQQASVQGQIIFLKKWLGEADEMEAEASG